MKKLGKELDCVKNKIKDIEREIELYSVKPDITRTRINRELEDLCMKYLWPEDYAKLEKAMIPYNEERMRTLDIAMETIG